MFLKGTIVYFYTNRSNFIHQIQKNAEVNLFRFLAGLILRLSGVMNESRLLEYIPFLLTCSYGHFNDFLTVLECEVDCDSYCTVIIIDHSLAALNCPLIGCDTKGTAKPHAT